MYLIWPLFFLWVIHCSKETRKRGFEELKGHTMHTWVVNIDVFEARTLKTSFGKSQMGVVVLAKHG
jgi:hypothetical protein